MTTESELVCPVCRAKQAYQSECRRCGADLSLWVKALRSLRIAQQRVVEAGRIDRQCLEAMRYLDWLSPKAARDANTE